MRTLLYTVPRPTMAIQKTSDITVSGDSDGKIKRSVWYITDGFTSDSLSKIATVRLVTNSKDQGWVDNAALGCYSWFEIAVVGPPAFTGQGTLERIKKRDDNSLCSWYSHGNPIKGSDYTINSGKFFTHRSELWTWVQEGDCLAVVACAQYTGWKNYGKAFTISYDEFFEPEF